MSVTMDLGKVGVLYKGEYDSTQTYERNDIVMSNGSGYIAKQNVPVGIDIGNTTYWGTVVVGADSNVFATKAYTASTYATISDVSALQAAVGSPLVASTVAGMTDHDKIYVYIGSETGYTSGNWYYYNGSAWVSGGKYNSQGIGDGTVTTAKLADGAVTDAKLAQTGGVLGEVADLKAAFYEDIQNNYTSEKVGNLYQTAYDSTYKYFSTSTTLRFKGGELIEIKNLPVGDRVRIRYDNVNHIPYGSYYIYSGAEKDVELRLYTENNTRNINDYVSVFYPKYPFNFNVYGNAVDSLFFPVAVSSNIITKALHRRTAFELDFCENDVINISDGYQINIDGTWYGNQYIFTSDTHLERLSVRDSNNNNADIHGIDISNVLTFKHNVHVEPINENNTGVYSLSKDVMAEIIISDDTTTGGAQGITNDENYIYVFNGNGSVVKVDRKTHQTALIPISYEGHGNGATYCPGNEHIYVADPDNSSVLEMSTSFEILNTYFLVDSLGNAIGKLNGVSYNNIDGKFYCFSYVDGKIYRYSSSFAYENETVLNFDFTNYQTQGFETDGMYYYIPLTPKTGTVGYMIIIFGLDGNEVSRRYVVDYLAEFEDLSISRVDDSIYGVYQMTSNNVWWCRVVEFKGDMDEWLPIDNIIREKNANVVFGANSDYPQYKVKGNKLYLKGKVINNNAVRTNCFRLVNCMSPKKRDTKEVSSYTNGAYTYNLLLMGNTSVFTNLTIPVAIDANGIVDITCASDSFSPMYPT